MWIKYKSTNSAAERKTVLNALGCTKNVKLLKVWNKLAFIACRVHSNIQLAWQKWILWKQLTYYSIASFQRYLNLILSKQIRLEDKHTALASTLKQRKNLVFVLDFIIAEHEIINAMYVCRFEIAFSNNLTIWCLLEIPDLRIKMKCCRFCCKYSHFQQPTTKLIGSRTLLKRIEWT